MTALNDKHSLVSSALLISAAEDTPAQRCQSCSGGGWYCIRIRQPPKMCLQRAVCVRQVLGIWTVLSDAQVARADS